MLVEMQGGMLNAYTTREQTVYVMQGFRENVPVMVDILSDMLQRIYSHSYAYYYLFISSYFVLLFFFVTNYSL